MKSEVLENGKSPQQKWTDSIEGTHIKSDSTNQETQIQDRRDHKAGELRSETENEPSKIPSDAP